MRCPLLALAAVLLAACSTTGEPFSQAPEPTAEARAEDTPSPGPCPPDPSGCHEVYRDWQGECSYHWPLPGLTPCPGGVCDGAGACVGCLTAEDCPAPRVTECDYATCEAGACGRAAKPKGNPCGVDNYGKSEWHACDGAGQCVSVPVP